VQLKRLRRLSEIKAMHPTAASSSAALHNSPPKSPVQPLRPGWKAFEQVGVLVKFPVSKPTSCRMMANGNYLHNVFMSLATVTNRLQDTVRKELATFVRLRSQKRCKWVRSLLKRLEGTNEGTLEEQPDLFRKSSYKGSRFVLAIACMLYHLDIFVLEWPKLDVPPLDLVQLRQVISQTQPDMSEFRAEQNKPVKALVYAFVNDKRPLTNATPNHYVLLDPHDTMKERYGSLLHLLDEESDPNESNVEQMKGEAAMLVDDTEQDAEEEQQADADMKSEGSRSFGPEKVRFRSTLHQFC
jgi:hypothetical protein